MKRRAGWLTVFPTLALICSVAGAAPDPLDRIVAKNTAARGGAGPIASVQAIHTTVQITEPQFQVIGEYFATRAGQMRIDILAGGKRVFTEAYDGRHGWQVSGDGAVSDMSEAGQKAVRHGIVFNLLGLFEMPGSGIGLNYVGTETIDGRVYEKVDLRFGDGHVNHFYLDGQTGQIVRERDAVALHPDVDDTVRRFETVHSDFRAVGGVVYAWRSEKKDMDTGDVVQDVVVLDIVQNPVIDRAMFARPGG